MKIKKGDKVIVIAGKEKGKQGTIARVLSKKDKVVVEDLNKVKKHVKPSQTNNEGKVETKEAPIHISNVALLDPKLKVATKISYKVEDGKKVRVAKKSSSIIK